jgi:hypothetical protein
VIQINRPIADAVRYKQQSGCDVQIATPYGFQLEPVLLLALVDYVRRAGTSRIL